MRRALSTFLLALALLTTAAVPLLQTVPPAFAHEWSTGD